MKLIVQVGEHRRAGEQSPRILGDRVDHQRAVDAFHHDLGVVRAQLIDPRHRVTVRGDVLHDARFVRERAAVARLAQHAARAELEDVAVASAGEQRPRFHGQTMRDFWLPQ